ncbi:DUF488 domain-containing protein [uncultured Legionella sp.]|uniref:DUF488 domain-containing protein n=1 Tax=uncultured Legionella sp. TaxID=210934 RepID=UPI00262A315C|nr:DUF488 family protein [uncultured Legionella sp.]
MKEISICRVYNPPASKTGFWILVDKLWPRGLKKDRIAFDLWLKDIAPGTALRQWFHQDPVAHWEEFSRRYVDELHHNKAVVERILEQAEYSPIILFYAAKDDVHNHALILQATLIAWPELPDIA